MLIIYFKSDGEIHQVATGYKSLKEFYGKRTEEFSLIFDAIYIDETNNYVFNNFFEFKIIDRILTAKENTIFRTMEVLNGKNIR